MNEADPNIKCQVGFFDDERAILRKHDENAKIILSAKRRFS